jgi:hypothetical protein
MIISSVNLTNTRWLLPEVVWIEPEHFEIAKQMSDRVNSESRQWQTYLSSLAVQSFEQWLSDSLPNQRVERVEIGTVSYLKVGEFKLCIIAVEHCLDEVVSVPQDTLSSIIKISNFYVVLEVLEEEEQVIIRGFMPCDQMNYYRSLLNLQVLQDGCYQLPLSLFDAEPHHLLLYCRYLAPVAVTLPVVLATTKIEADVSGYLNETRTKLTQWLQGIFDETWFSLDALIDPEINLSLNTRSINLGLQKGKLIDLQMQIGSQKLALLVSVAREEQAKLGVYIQLHPTKGNKYLPPNLRLILLSKAGKTLQEVISRSHDNYIQLNSFKGEAGKCFSIEVSLDDVSIRENFEF